ncbi:MAG TPA: hypothetical protein VKS24_09680 [Bradyrhizobium sp.]|nr:hypothetical protein [Bradyrhizobium sp.]
MRRFIAIAATATSLAGCSSFSVDYFKSAPPPVQLQLESTPPGADARTSIGPTCKTPCAVSVTPPEGGFTVSYAMTGFQPATVPVQVIRSPGSLMSSGTTKIEPNPVFAQLQPVAPPPPIKPIRPKRKKPKTAAPAAAGSAFPEPGQAVPPPPASTR